MRFGTLQLCDEHARQSAAQTSTKVDPFYAAIWSLFNLRLTGIDDNAASQGYVLGDDDIRARVDIGIDLVDDQGRSLAVSGYYDGLGVEDYEAMGGEIRLSIPIQ